MKTYCQECGKEMVPIDYYENLGRLADPRGYKCEECNTLYRYELLLVKLEPIDGYKVINQVMGRDKAQDPVRGQRKIKLDCHGLPE